MVISVMASGSAVVESSRKHCISFRLGDHGQRGKSPHDTKRCPCEYSFRVGEIQLSADTNSRKTQDTHMWQQVSQCIRFDSAQSSQQ